MSEDAFPFFFLLSLAQSVNVFKLECSQHRALDIDNPQTALSSSQKVRREREKTQQVASLWAFQSGVEEEGGGQKYI